MKFLGLGEKKVANTPADPAQVAQGGQVRQVGFDPSQIADGPSGVAIERLSGRTPSGLNMYDHLPAPKSVGEAFDNIKASSVGPALVRRFADDNVGAWNMVLDMTRQAKKTQDFSFFTIGKDAYGYAFLGGALYNQLRGVQVQGMTDWSSNSRGRGFVSFGLGYDYLQELAAAGAKIGVYNTIKNRVSRIFDYGIIRWPVKREGLKFEIGKGQIDYGLIGCNHDKLMLIDKGTDDAVGQTGGRNMEAPYHQDVLDNAKSWRDDSIQMRGNEATLGLANGLERELAGPGCKLVKADKNNATSRARELLFAYAMMEEWVSQKPFSEAEKAAFRADPESRRGMSERLFDAANQRLQAMIERLPAEKAAGIPKALSPQEIGRMTKLAFDLSNDLELAGSRARYDQAGGWIKGDVKIIDQQGAPSAAPGERHNEMAPGMIHLFRGAQRELVIQNPYVVLTENMVQLFEELAARGVKIKIVTNSPASTDSAITQAFFLNEWPNILARVPTMEIHVATGERKFHAKCFTIDGEVSGDLSFNADLLSGLVNGEVGAITKSKEAAEHLNLALAADLSNPSNGFEQWTIKRDAKKRPVFVNGEPVIENGLKEFPTTGKRIMYPPLMWLTKKAADVTLSVAPLNLRRASELLARNELVLPKE